MVLIKSNDSLYTVVLEYSRFEKWSALGIHSMRSVCVYLRLFKLHLNQLLNVESVCKFDTNSSRTKIRYMILIERVCSKITF